MRDIVDVRETGLGGRFGGRGRALAAAAQQHHDGILAAHLRFQFARKAGIAVHGRAGGPRHVQRGGHVADESAFFMRSHVDQHGFAGLHQLPRILRADDARIRQALRLRLGARKIEHFVKRRLAMRGAGIENQFCSSHLSTSLFRRQKPARVHCSELMLFGKQIKKSLES
ncbi:hypothetical protein D3C72_1538700 [compost metagenome]